MQLKHGYIEPDWIVGYDTETYNGHILTQQIVTRNDEQIEWVDDESVLENYLAFLSKLKGNGVVFCFSASFDLALLLRKFIIQFLNDDFQVTYRGWTISVICSKNWQATFEKRGCNFRFFDIRTFFAGNLETVSKMFNLKKGKLERPERLGYEKFTEKNRKFVEYAMHDAKLCYIIGKKIVDMCKEYDIPIASSAANFAEKVFRRKFLQGDMQIQYTPSAATRMAELTYHGGKNGYYLQHPSLISNCYEYDFNAAYGYAMYCLPSFLQGTWKQVKSFDTEHVGVYQVNGELKKCSYGILYDLKFQYFRESSQMGNSQNEKSVKESVTCYATSFEISEAIRCKEFVLKSCIGWVWIPKTDVNPLRDYVRYFWDKKNNSEKGTTSYLFNKICLNSLYGKWIQRNPLTSMKIVETKGKLRLSQETEVSGGLYHPFIATLITGFTRARLHHYEHEFDAIETSTDSVKSQKKVKLDSGFGQMELQNFHCKLCNQEVKSFTGLFLRNRLNLCMDDKKHILKCALHGFWGTPQVLYKLWKERETEYSVYRMPLIREGLKQYGKPLFQMSSELRSVKIDWTQFRVY